MNQVRFNHKDSAMIDRVIKGFTGEGLFKEFLPTPKELLENEGWYDWNIAHWGTKWDVTDVVEPVGIIRFDNGVSITFDSAWSPPIEFYSYMEDLGFEVTAYYFEPGMDFCGIYSEGYDDYYEGTDGIPDDLDSAFGISEWKAEAGLDNNEEEV
jgi:hypothetical protein